MKRPGVTKHRFERSDVSRPMSFNPETGQSETLAEWAVKYDIIRTDIMMVNVSTGPRLKDLVQLVALPCVDGTYWVPEKMEEYLTADDHEWMTEESRRVAEAWGRVPELRRHLRQRTGNRGRPLAA